METSVGAVRTAVCRRRPSGTTSGCVGLTIAGTDQEDVYVEEINPANENEGKFNGAWEPLRDR
jgi:hypothetical protein